MNKAKRAPDSRSTRKTKSAPNTKPARNIKPARNAALFLVTKKDFQSQDGGFSGDFQDLCSLAMDRAIGIEKATLSSAVSLNSAVIDIYKNAFWFAPAFGELLDTAANSFAFCMELQKNWLTIMAPHAYEESGALLHDAAPPSTVASNSGKQRRYRRHPVAKAA